MERITLRAIADADIPIVKKWLSAPHVAKWFGNAQDWLDEIEKRSGEFGFMNYFIACREGEPIGFCDYYDYSFGGETWHGQDDVAGAYCMDYMIGEPENLGRGYGKQMVMALIGLIRRHENAKIVIADPNAANTASRALLISCGFSPAGGGRYLRLSLNK